MSNGGNDRDPAATRRFSPGSVRLAGLAELGTGGYPRPAPPADGHRQSDGASHRHLLGGLCGVFAFYGMGIICR